MSRAGTGSSKDTSTRQTSREATGAKEDGAEGDADDDKGAGGREEPLRRRRAPGTVAGRACNECRQARQKVSEVVAIGSHTI